MCVEKSTVRLPGSANSMIICKNCRRASGSINPRTVKVSWKALVNHPGHGVVQQVDVVSESAHQGAGGLAVEEEDRGWRCSEGKELVPEGGDGGVADVAHLVVVGVGQKPLKGVKQDDQGRQQEEHAFFVPEEDVVQDRFHQIGQAAVSAETPSMARIAAIIRNLWGFR